MAYDYKYINTVAGNPRYGQVYAVEAHPGGGEFHIYPDGTKMLVSGTSDVLASNWHPPQVTVVAGPAAAAAVASGAVSTPTTVIEPPAPAAPPPPKTIAPLSPAAALGISADTYAAEQNAVKPLNTDAANGIPAGGTPSPRNPDGPAAAAAGVSYDTYEAEQNAIKPLNTDAAQGIPAGGTTASTSTTTPQTLQEPPGSIQVTSGMTFWDLEERHGWPHGTLQDLNPGLNPKSLQVGSFVSIPQATPTVGATGGNPASAAEASSVGPSSSVYESNDSKIKTAAANLKARFTGWGGQGADSPDPLKTVVEAVEHPPKTNPNPLDNHDPHSV